MSESKDLLSKTLPIAAIEMLQIRAVFPGLAHSPVSWESVRASLQQTIDEWMTRDHRDHPEDVLGYLLPSISPVGSTPTSRTDDALRARVDGVTAERESLKTQLIALHRQLLELYSRLDEGDRQIARLEKQNDGQLTCISDTIKLNESLQRALLGTQDGSVCLREVLEGVVVKQLEDGVVAEFDTSSGKIEQFYELSQFERGKIPTEGDRLSACIFLLGTPPMRYDADSLLTEDERKQGFSGFNKGIERARKRKS